MEGQGTCHGGTRERQVRHQRGSCERHNGLRAWQLQERTQQDVELLHQSLEDAGEPWCG